MFIGARPTIAVVFMIEQNRTTDPSYLRSPFKFENFGVKSVRLDFAGQKYPQTEEDFNFLPPKNQLPNIIQLVSKKIVVC